MRWRRRLEPGAGPVLGEVPRPGRQWTFMVYMAGDNNLEHCAEDDLAEIKRVGSTPEVAVVAQVDRRSDEPTRRYYLTPDASLTKDQVGDDLPETNTGDPAELMRFLTWAMETYPAQRYALVLWNHGSGWKEDDLYELAGLASSGDEPTAAPLLKRALDGSIRAMFRPSLRAILARGIAYDDSSGDFLDNSELKRALGCALTVSGVPKLDLIGFDACLMAMIEVAYQMRDAARYMVGSQDAEPGQGWPYDGLLGPLVERPTMDASELAAVIVQAFMAGYGPLDNITQSALDLDRLPDVVSPLNALVGHILDHQADLELAVFRAARRAQLYGDPDYKDLHDFCRLLGEYGGEGSELARRAQAVMDTIVPPGQGRFVLAEDHRGYRVGRSHGISIYFPQRALSPFYHRLDFASETLWDDLLLRLIGV